FLSLYSLAAGQAARLAPTRTSPSDRLLSTFCPSTLSRPARPRASPLQELHRPTVYFLSLYSLAAGQAARLAPTRPSPSDRLLSTFCTSPFSRAASARVTRSLRTLQE